MVENVYKVKDLLNNLDTTLHVPVRLGTMMMLYLNSSLTFSNIQKGLGVTSGNLNTHLTNLNSKGYIKQEKEFINVRPRTVVKITPEGKKAVKSYVKSLKSVLSELGELYE